MAQAQSLLEIYQVAKSDSLFILPPEVHALAVAKQYKQDTVIPFKTGSQVPKKECSMPASCFMSLVKIL